MTQDTQIEIQEFKHQPIKGAKIVIVGVGGGGSNMVSYFYRKNTHKDLTLIVANTDNQHLHACPVPNKIQLGERLTGGLGAGADDEVGKKAALESADEIKQKLEGADMVIVCVGLGGGTGTGAAPVIAQIAKDMGALTVSISTKPFMFEGMKRAKTAARGFDELSKASDSNIVVPNDKILSIIGRATGYRESYSHVDEILTRAASGISGVILGCGATDVNVDFADLRKVMQCRGLALMGVGEGAGENSCIDALRNAIESPLFDNLSINGAKGIIVNFEMNPDFPLMQINEAMQYVHEVADSEADIIMGTRTDEEIPVDSMRVTVIATGFEKTIATPKSAAKPQEAQKPATKPQEAVLPDIFRQLAVGGEEVSVDYDKPAWERNKMD